MSELLYSVNEPSMVKAYKSYINDINQVMKTSKKSSNYIVIGGEAYSMLVHNDNEGYFSSNLSPQISDKKKALLKAEVHKGIKYLNGAFNGKELFEFYKNHKKIISEFNFYNDYFEILTEDEDVKFESSILTNKNFELQAVRKVRNITDDYELVYEKDLSEDEIESIKSAKFPYILKTDEINIRLINKYLFVSKSDVSIQVYKTSSQLFYITLTFVNDLFKVTTNFNALKY